MFAGYLLDSKLSRMLRRMNGKFLIIAFATVLALIPNARAQEEPPASSAARESSSTLGLESISELLRRAMDDPLTAERQRQILKAKVKQTYADFAKSAQLPTAQAEDFIELLTDREMIDFQDLTSFSAGDPDAESAESIAKLSPIAWTEIAQRLKLLLSETSYAQLQEYEKTISERVALAEIRRELAMNSEPLNEEQIRFLLQVLFDERQKTPPVAFDPRRVGRSRESAQVAVEGDNAARYFDMQADLDRRVLARAKGVLSPEQFDALAKFQRQYSEVARSGVELTRKILARRKS